MANMIEFINNVAAYEIDAKSGNATVHQIRLYKNTQFWDTIGYVRHNNDGYWARKVNNKLYCKCDTLEEACLWIYGDNPSL